jgi:hypothetical protein
MTQRICQRREGSGADAWDRFRGLSRLVAHPVPEAIPGRPAQVTAMTWWMGKGYVAFPKATK